MNRLAGTALTLLLAGLLCGCSTSSPANEGEAYGSTIRNSDPLVKCINEGIRRYEDDKDRTAFRESCLERAQR